MPLAWKTICAPTDLSVASRHAFRTAAELAVKFNAELLIVFVQIVPVATYFTVPLEQALLDHMEAGAKAELERWKLEAEAIGAPRVRAVALKGLSEFNEIVMFAERSDVDVIVMGTHGRTALSHVLLGSVAEKVVRHARCAVLTVRPPTLEPPARSP